MIEQLNLRHGGAPRKSGIYFKATLTRVTKVAGSWRRGEEISPHAPKSMLEYKASLITVSQVG